MGAKEFGICKVFSRMSSSSEIKQAEEIHSHFPKGTMDTLCAGETGASICGSPGQSLLFPSVLWIPL